LGSVSTYPLSTRGTKHLKSRRSLPHCLGSLGSLSSYLVLSCCLLHTIHPASHFNFPIPLWGHHFWSIRGFSRHWHHWQGPFDM
jgi:hypothetical protein